MKVKLNIPERIAGIRLLNENQDSLTLTGMRSALELLDLFVISTEEKKKVGFEETTNKETGARQIVWKDGAYEKEMEISDEQKAVLDDIIAQKDKQKKFTLSEGKALLQLVDKLK